MSLGTLAIALLSPPAGGAEEPQAEHYRAQMVVETRTGRQRSMVDIRITRWTLAEEKDALSTALASGDRYAFIEALRNQPVVGSVQIQGGTPQKLHYGRQNTEGGRRILTVYTDEVVGLWTGDRLIRNPSAPIDGGPPVVRYDTERKRELADEFSIIELRLDDQGRGTGTLLAGVEASFDAARQQVDISRYRTRIKLEKVRAIESP